MKTPKIEKTDSGKYRVRKQINGRRISLYFSSKPTQKEILDRIIVEENKTANKPCYDINFETAADSLIASKVNVLSPCTVREYKKLIRAVPEWFRSTMISQITSMSVQMAINEYAENHAPKSVRNLSGFILSVLRLFSIKIDRLPTLPQKIQNEPYTPTQSDIQKVIEYFSGTQYEIPLRLACYGLRRSEITALRYPEDFKGNYIHIQNAIVRDENNNLVRKSTKTTASDRTIYIDDELLNLIKNTGHIYEGFDGSINKALVKAEKKLGLPHFSLHKFRHYFCTVMSQELPEADVLALGGWVGSSDVMKRIYRHAEIKRDNEMKKRAASLVASSIKNGQ